MKNLYLTLLIMLTVVFTSSCQKDSDLLAEILISEEPIEVINLQDAILLPPDFDWSNIPADFGDSIWEITEDYDLGGLTITLPPNVTLYFNGGSLLNGTLTGDKTEIISKIQTQVFDGLDLAGSFETEYLKPYWFGAVMDGVTDDRDIFVETLKQSNNINAKVLIEKDIFLDVTVQGKKSIFLEDNTWIEGANNANLITNNLHSPAFYMVLTKNITVKNITFLHDQIYNAASIMPTNDYNSNISNLQTYLETNHNIIFASNSLPTRRGGFEFLTIFTLEASQNILFENINFKAKGKTADSFIQWAIKLKEQFTSNQTITNNIGNTDIPRNIKLTNVTIDGALMGIQGIVDGFKCSGLKGYRYSDMQNADGSNLGGFDGSEYGFAPPHLIYINGDGSTNYSPENIEILNTIDYGEYVGTPKVRGTSGYCVSLTLTGTHNNVLVDNYKSYRRDGFLGLQDMNNAIFKNIYTEYDSSIWDGITTDFNNIRFVGTLNNVKFENIVIKDKAKVAKYYPLTSTQGDFVTMDNVHVYINELNTIKEGFIGFSGSNNKISNSSVNIEKHTSLRTYTGVIYHNGNDMGNVANNNYEVIVNGWRDIKTDPLGRRIRMLFASEDNLNNNFAIVKDNSNNIISEQIKNIIKDTWTRKEVVDLGQGNSHLLTFNIPAGFTVSNIEANTLESLATGVTVSIGTSSILKGNLLSEVSKTSGMVSKVLNELNPINSNRSIYLFTNGDFQNKGKIEVTVELVRLSMYN